MVTDAIQRAGFGTSECSSTAKSLSLNTSLYVEKLRNSCLTHFFENMIKLKILKLEEEFNSRIEMLAVQMALLWPCFFLFQQVPLARTFLVIVITARSLRVVCMQKILHEYIISLFLGRFFCSALLHFIQFLVKFSLHLRLFDSVRLEIWPSRTLKY